MIGLDPEAPLGSVAGVAVDSRGTIVIADSGFDTVVRFTGDGAYRDAVGRVGEGPGEYAEPLRVAVGPGDRIYVAGHGTRIVVLEPDGAPADFEIRRVNSGTVHGLRVAPDGAVYTVSFDAPSRTMIQKYDGATHELAAAFCDTYGAGREIPPHIEGVYAVGSMDLAADGRVYYVQNAPQRVRVFDAGGTLLAEHAARFADAPGLPEAKVEGDAVSFTSTTWSNGILALKGGRFLTGFSRRTGEETWSSTLDLYDADGDRLASVEPERNSWLLARDDRGRVYAAEVRDDLPVLVRYRIAAPAE